MSAESLTIKAKWTPIPDVPDAPDTPPDTPTLSTEIYAVKQNADGTWTAVSLETSGESAYQVAELYSEEHLSASAYSFSAYTDENGRTPISAGGNVSLADADGKLYLYYARDAFDQMPLTLAPLCHCVTSPPKGETQRRKLIKSVPPPQRGGGQGEGFP